MVGNSWTEGRMRCDDGRGEEEKEAAASEHSRLALALALALAVQCLAYVGDNGQSKWVCASSCQAPRRLVQGNSLMSETCWRRGQGSLGGEVRTAVNTLQT